MSIQIYPKLLIEEGPAPGQKIELDQTELVIGREPGVDLVIPSISVSRRHARLFLRDNQYVLEDLGSSNGTFLNGMRILAATILNPGDEIHLGQVIRLKYLGMDHDQDTLVGEKSYDERETGESLETPVEMDPRIQTDAGPQAMTRVAGGPSTGIPSPPQLRVEIPGIHHQTYTMTSERVSLGRAGDNDIVIPSNIVSSHHAVIEKVNGQYQLQVLRGATNPITFKGQSLLAPLELRDGDRLQIGWDPSQMVTLAYQAQAGISSTTIDFREKSRIQIGRDPSNDVVIEQPTVSRFHTLVERIGQRYRVSDLRSTNGTFVNGERVEGESWLTAGDEILIGRHRFVLGENQLTQFLDPGGMRLEALGLNKWVRKDLNLLKDIMLVFQPREFIVIVGQSGGGKSTLLDAVAGFRPASHGKVMVNGVDIYRHFDSIRNEIGFVPQRDIIHMELTVYQALDYAAQLRMPADTTREERHQRVMEVLQELDLVHRKDVQISGLSGGQQKRVSIGVELLTQPGLFFLDEPTSGLDPGTETSLMRLMRRLADQGRTIVLVTHATKNVSLADKVLFLARGGYVTWFGPPDEALSYFDQFRSERDQRARPMEFDEIYAILDDPEKGQPEDWAQRFLEHPAYQKYIIQPLKNDGRQLPQGDPYLPIQPAAPGKKASKTKRPRVSALRQFFILSKRNLRILTRDRIGLALMLGSAPLIAMVDVVLSFILGRNLFDFFEGDMANALTSLFQPIILGIMVGALAQMREFVKEADIYKRERLVNLNVLPYVLSKIWVAGFLALYQAAAYTIIHYLSFDMPGGVFEFGLFYFTVLLATLAGMMLGLLSSAISPNANAAPLIVILLIIPQVVLGGALIPVPDTISAPTSSRWGFEAVVGITGLGSDVASDSCWVLTKEERDELSLDDKNRLGCSCMGLNALRDSSCSFPGLGEFYHPAIDSPEPLKPTDVGEPPPEPEFPIPPTGPSNPTDQAAVAAYLEELQSHQEAVEQLQADYRTQVDDYQSRADAYGEAIEAYQEDLARWEIDRNAAVGKAEAVIESFYDNFGWAFIDNDDEAAFWSRILFAWGMQGVIISTLFGLIVVSIYRKDRGR